jgi:hypothetical protein
MVPFARGWAVEGPGRRGRRVAGGSPFPTHNALGGEGNFHHRLSGGARKAGFLSICPLPPLSLPPSFPPSTVATP